MAHLKATASEVQYDLFLSFSGDDTRYNFIGFLHQGLEKARIRVFRDEDEIKVGDKIGKTILQAIDNSKFYKPIISQTYPDCKWCLIELERMMNNVSGSKDRKRIFPIFYKVEPGDVKHRTPHPENISSKVELRKFKKALAKVGTIKGWKVHEQQSQIEIVDKVVQKVLEVLGRKEESETEYPIELDDLTQSLEDSLNLVDKVQRETIGRERSLSRGRIHQFEGNVICKEREASVGREREENRKYKEYVEEEQMRSVGREMEDDGKHMKYVSDEQMRKGTSVGWTRETSRRREREDDKKHMEYVVEEQMRRGTSVGKTREDDGKDMKYVQEKWLRGGTSASSTRGASVRREREDDGKLMQSMPKKWLRVGMSIGIQREDDEKYMKYMLEERMRRGMSIGKEREYDGKQMKFVLEERMRGGTSVDMTKGTSVRREREDDGKLGKYVLEEWLKVGTSVGREREDDGKYMLEERMRRGKSVGKEREYDGKQMKFVLEERLREGRM